jgi:hypothetical protein
MIIIIVNKTSLLLLFLLIMHIQYYMNLFDI